MSRKRHKTLDKFMARAFAGGAPRTRTSKVVTGGKVESIQEPVVIRKTPILWGIPCDEVMYARFFRVFETNANKMPWDGFAATEGTYLPEARNFIHNAFLENSDLPYLMMIDSDILFPPHIVDRLMAHKLPIVGGWYRDKKAVPNHPVVYDFVSETDGIANWRHRDTPGNGIEKVDAIGAGCLLMERSTAEALGMSPFDMNSGGEDMKLSRKLMKLGISLHVDWDMAVAHAGVFQI